MGKLRDAILSGAMDLSTEGYDIGVVEHERSSQVIVIFATNRAVEWAEGLGVRLSDLPARI